MKPSRVLAGICFVALAACSREPAPEYNLSSGSLAISRDGTELYAVDTDNNLVSVLSASDMRKLADIKVGERPQRIAVGHDGTLFVTNKAERTVSAIRRGTWEEIGRTVVGIEPIGVDVTGDGEHVLVASSTALTDVLTGTLTSLNARTLAVEWQVEVGPEAYAVKAMPGDKAYVSLFKSGKVAVVDLKSRALVGHVDLGNRTNAGVFGSGALPLEPNPNDRVAGAPNLVTDIVVSPDGERAFVPHIRARDTNVIQQTSGGGGYGGGGGKQRTGTCGRGAIAAAALGTLVVSDDSALVDDFSKCRDFDDTDFNRQEFPTNILDPNPTGADPVQGPETALVDTNGDFVYVANLLTNNVTVVSTRRRTGDGLIGNTGISQIIRTGSGPTGLALSPDGKSLYVHHQFDHSVGVYRPDEGGRIAEISALRARYAGDVLPPGVVEGRRLFFSADNPMMTDPSSPIACGSCHPSGREDGRVWPFPEGPRQTPGLAGRKLGETAPYHWGGEFETINQFFEETVVNRMGGKGFAGPKDPAARNLMDFMIALETPDNPNRGKALTERQEHGKELFKTATCDTCHTGEAMTDGKNYDVGSLAKGTGILRPGDSGPTLNTPSLLGLSRTWPYLHDGSATTLKERMLHNRQSNKHGLTARLSDADVDDLVEYLKTL